MSKQCQSCGMPLQTNKAGDCRGTEADGTKSEKWCSLCYENGAFIGPDCTLDEMKTIVDKALVENGSGRLMRWLAQKQLPHLERWKTSR
ncbi:MAG: zinc ribbon domain-containing protein [Candidatus Saccharimonadales bacterium]